MDIFITAGGIPQSNQSLYEYTQGAPKVMLEILGKPMVQWVLDAVSGCRNIRRVFVAGLPKDTKLTCKYPLMVLENKGDLLANIQNTAEEAIRLDPQVKNAVMISGDIPGITAPMIEWLIDKVKDGKWDVVYTVIDKSVIEKTFPNSRRTFTKLKDMTVCGGDITSINPHIMLDTKARWRKIIEARKNPLKQAALIGFDTLILLLTRQVTLAQAEKRVTRRLNINGKVFVAPYAEMGMDVDKSFQFEIMRDYLTKRTAQ